ncbi:hypothetical protein ANN_26985 [Periplaneta americana]|uniref:Uncharacterized protein n=1 Tax=Periplaneta americana TaxID=6978 RepID=A0ABQ8RWS2_PERAM|nr:hypothetical protein ANN_26985 [Periplaneta americana]
MSCRDTQIRPTFCKVYHHISPTPQLLQVIGKRRNVNVALYIPSLEKITEDLGQMITEATYQVLVLGNAMANLRQTLVESSISYWSGALLHLRVCYCRCEALRNIRHHALRSMLAEALKEIGFTVHQEVQGLATQGNVQRIDIIAIKNNSAYILDPTIRFETHADQPREVDSEKKRIYEPTIPFYKDKYSLFHIDVIEKKNVTIDVIFIKSMKVTLSLPRFYNHSQHHLFVSNLTTTIISMIFMNTTTLPSAAYVTTIIIIITSMISH